MFIGKKSNCHASLSSIGWQAKCAHHFKLKKYYKERLLAPYLIILQEKLSFCEAFCNFLLIADVYLNLQEPYWWALIHRMLHHR